VWVHDSQDCGIAYFFGNIPLCIVTFNITALVAQVKYLSSVWDLNPLSIVVKHDKIEDCPVHLN
jgi:hypothetical protein